MMTDAKIRNNQTRWRGIGFANTTSFSLARAFFGTGFFDFKRVYPVKWTEAFLVWQEDNRIG